MSEKQGIKKKLMLSFGMIIVLVVVLLEGAFLLALREYYYASTVQFLTNRSAISTQFFNKYYGGARLSETAGLIIENLPPDEIARVEVLDWRHRVISDSYGFPSERIINTPDVQRALGGQTGKWEGEEGGNTERLLAISQPLRFQDHIVGVVRYTVSLEKIDDHVNNIIGWAFLLGMLVIAFSLLVSMAVAKKIIAPIQTLTRAADAFARGDYTHPVHAASSDEIGTLAHTMEHMADEIRKTEQLKNDFISSVSHELRTPLTSVKGWAETLLSGDPNDREETEMGLRVILKETDRLILLVEDLLDFSKLHSEKIKLDRKQIDLRALLLEVDVQFEVRAKEKGICLQTSIAEGEHRLLGDPNRLKQVLVNLLDNALKFTPPTGWIRLSLQPDGMFYRIDIADSGEGISPEDIQRVTEKFYKGKSRLSGSGIGLAVSKEIIRGHRGQLLVASKVGAGTVVTLLLPSSDSFSDY
ncbi:sensor histidine kinase [Aneurinibacillus sp. REN35]|uniref:sensor histidine kinase n=1 Tax=Aneurinibacillus sp. REN35 TaxID=3237286 RepID=UPI003527CF8D